LFEHNQFNIYKLQRKVDSGRNIAANQTYLRILKKEATMRLNNLKLREIQPLLYLEDEIKKSAFISNSRFSFIMSLRGKTINVFVELLIVRDEIISIFISVHDLN